MYTHHEIADNLNISLDEAIEVVNYITCFFDIDLSECSYSEIFKACKKAMKDMKASA